MRVSVSILDCDFARLGEELRKVDEAGADAIHLDVMDGHFVPNLSFGVPLVAAVRRATALPLDTHLMVREPEKMIPWFLPPALRAGSPSDGSGMSSFSFAPKARLAAAEPPRDMVGFHVEATTQPERCFTLIRDAGKKASISLNPDTPLDALLPWLAIADDVLVMSVFPGRGGQKFIPEALERIRRIKAALAEKNPRASVSVDGGINPDNCRDIAQAGADWLIAGSAVFRSTDYAATIRALKER